MRQAQIYRKNILAGLLTEEGGEYIFRYDSDYLTSPKAAAISLTLPLQQEAYTCPVLFPFFDGLIPEGGCSMWRYGIPTSVFLTVCPCCCYAARSASAA